MLEDLASTYREKSHVLIEGAYDRSRVQRLLMICERVREQWRHAPLTHNPPVGPRAAYMRHLNHPDYHRDHPEDLAFLLDAVAEPRLIEAIGAAMGEPFVFVSTSYFFNPAGESYNGQWHKDKGQDPDDPRDVQTGVSLQLQIPLVASDDLQLVPGSHLRDYNEDERRIILDDDGKNSDSDAMPGGVRLYMRPGDAAMFNPYCIHRGRYHVETPRRTLMFSFIKTRQAKARLAQRGLDQYSDQPWFLLPEYLNGTKPKTAQFFEDFISAYAEQWRMRWSEMQKYFSLMMRLNQSNRPSPFFSR
jgi:ectoine hydroxylase-related dioxygenase (phytanoyl-CoA dioxygenase family)